ncbi:unnamed protein product [Caenorhabditis brenneri]
MPFPFCCNKVSKKEKEESFHCTQGSDPTYGGEVVKLNVGGTVFQTSKSTLTKLPGFFKNLFEIGYPTNDYFIDRDPKFFATILNFMRDGDVDLPDSEADRQEILREAQFYKLTDLVATCQKKKNEEFMKIRNLKNEEDVLNAILTSTKKAVLIIYYVSYNGFVSTAVMANHLLKYRDDFDVYLKHKFPIPEWRFEIFRIETGETYKGPIDSLETTVKVHFPK